jgi:hypothetical protein
MKLEMPANRKTYLLDIDGTLIYHKDNLSDMIRGDMNLLNGTVEKLLQWRMGGHYIILTTARPEGVRAATERQLHEAGIFYDQLVMGLPTGSRVLVNDMKPDGTLTAQAINLNRNEGIYGIKV